MSTVVARSIPFTPRATMKVAPRMEMMCGTTGMYDDEKSRQNPTELLPVNCPPADATK